MPWLATCVLLLCAPPLLGAVVSVLVHGPSRQLLHAAMRTGCLWIAASLAQSGPGRSHATALVKCAWRSRGACCSLLSQDAPTQMPCCLCLSWQVCLLCRTGVSPQQFGVCGDCSGKARVLWVLWSVAVCERQRCTVVDCSQQVACTCLTVASIGLQLRLRRSNPCSRRPGCVGYACVCVVSPAFCLVLMLSAAAATATVV